MKNKKIISSMISITTPIITSILMIYYSIYLPEGVLKDNAIKINFGFISYEHGVKNIDLRYITIFLSLSFFIFAVIRDYSGFFPKIMKVNALFDDKGIEKLLKNLKKDKRFSFEIYDDWHHRKENFIKELEKSVFPKTGKNIDFLNGSAMRSNGTTEFNIKKSQFFTQEYLLSESYGSITTNESQSGLSITTSFNIQRDEEIDVSFFDMFFYHSFIVNPEYCQKHHANLIDLESFSNVIASTKIRFFPWVNIGKSLYLVKDKKDNKYYPIGYCDYNY